MSAKTRAILAVAVLATLVLAGTGEAFAQRGGGGRPPIEFSATYGSMWGGNIGLRTGKLRTGTGDSWGFALDVPMRPNTWLEASYGFQNGSLDWDPSRDAKITLTDMTVHVWQLGSLQGFGRPGGPVMPYLQGGLGLTYFSPSEKLVTIDNEDYNIDSMTKFSITFGAGFKAYFGEAKKIGLRGSFKVISTLYDAGGGVFFGPGGASVGVSGSGIWQYEVAGGLTVKFGG
jgi:hypothetical protein